jgi:hypothetical protein
MRKDRLRAKKSTHKLTWDHVRWIRQQQGILSVRQTAKEFSRHTHYIYKVSPSMVHHIWSGQRWAPLQCGLCELTEENGITFSTSKEICDGCYKIKAETEEQKQKRINRAKRLTNITSKLIEDETELIDLPYRLREQIYKNKDTPQLNKENLFRSGSTEKTYSDPTEDHAAIYAIHFTHSEETDSMVYVGQTTQGVLQRFRQHLGDVRADSRKRPARCGTPAYRNLLRALMRDSQHHTIKIQVLDIVDQRHKKELNEEEYKTFLNELEQAWQFKLMVRGYTLLNASIKISASFHKEAREYMIENLTKEPSDKAWLSSQGVGCFVGEQLPDDLGKGKIAGCSWAYEPLQSDDA